MLLNSFFRLYISFNNALKGKTKTELTNSTNCLPPCHFWKYTQIGDPHVRNQKSFGKLTFYKYRDYGITVVIKEACLGYVFLLASSDVITEEETLIYDMISFVSEFGGSLGLFLGFSFFMLASYIAPSLMILKNILKQL